MANHREIGSLLIIVDNRVGGKINEENRESPAKIVRVGMSGNVLSLKLPASIHWTYFVLKYTLISVEFEGKY